MFLGARRGHPPARHLLPRPGQHHENHRCPCPDAPLIDADGTKTTLFDLFRGPHQTRLRFGPATPAQAPHTVDLFRTAGGGGYVSPEAFVFYDATDGTELLVRSDGYLA
ncbi:hypothetical protein [Streptomyces sp. SudanB135_2055]|uniref:hypothetical protein n=1 Tax=Streptomyces sp. SudanB135_2055 TaxID=3035279 RepID=UPI0036DE2939